MKNIRYITWLSAIVVIYNIGVGSSYYFFGTSDRPERVQGNVESNAWIERETNIEKLRDAAYRNLRIANLKEERLGEIRQQLIRMALFNFVLIGIIVFLSIQTLISNKRMQSDAATPHR
jgi:hypothetical protein